MQIIQFFKVIYYLFKKILAFLNLILKKMLDVNKEELL